MVEDISLRPRHGVGNYFRRCVIFRTVGLTEPCSFLSCSLRLLVQRGDVALEYALKHFGHLVKFCVACFGDLP